MSQVSQVSQPGRWVNHWSHMDLWPGNTWASLQGQKKREKVIMWLSRTKNLLSNLTFSLCVCGIKFGICTCLYMYACVQAKGWYCFHKLLLVLFLREFFSHNLEFTDWWGLPDQDGIIDTRWPQQSFSMHAGTMSSHSHACVAMIYQLSHLPNP